MFGEVAVVLQFLRPGSYLPDLGSGDSGNEPAELVSVKRVQIVGEVSGLAATYQPIDRSSNKVRIVTGHDHGTQRERRAPGDSRGGDAAAKLRLHYVTPPGNCGPGVRTHISLAGC